MGNNLFSSRGPPPSPPYKTTWDNTPTWTQASTGEGAASTAASDNQAAKGAQQEKGAKAGQPSRGNLTQQGRVEDEAWGTQKEVPVNYPQCPPESLPTTPLRRQTDALAAEGNSPAADPENQVSANDNEATAMAAWETTEGPNLEGLPTPLRE
jgi:hypothetical protein